MANHFNLSTKKSGPSMKHGAYQNYSHGITAHYKSKLCFLLFSEPWLAQNRVSLLTISQTLLVSLLNSKCPLDLYPIEYLISFDGFHLLANKSQIKKISSFLDIDSENDHASYDCDDPLFVDALLIC